MQTTYPLKLEIGFPGLVIHTLRRVSGVHEGQRRAHRVQLTPVDGATEHRVEITYRGQSYVLEVASTEGSPASRLIAALGNSSLFSALLAYADGENVVLESRHPGVFYRFTVTPTGYTATTLQEASDGDPLPPGVVVSQVGNGFVLGGSQPAGIALRDHVYGHTREHVVGVGDVGEARVRPGRHIDVLQQGEVWGSLAAGANPGVGSLARYQTSTGLLTTATGSGTAALPGGVFRGGAVTLETGERIARVSLFI
jgi:hypothetical protein